MTALLNCFGLVRVCLYVKSFWAMRKEGNSQERFFGLCKIKIRQTTLSPEILTIVVFFICSKDCNVMEKLTIIADEVCTLNHL